MDLPPDTPLVYANWVRMNASLFDLAMDFGYNEEPGPPDSVPVRVIMSWEHAKAFANLLTENIAAYEEQVREIVDFEDEEDGVRDGD